jgi:general secretion pathway protein D
LWSALLFGAAAVLLLGVEPKAFAAPGAIRFAPISPNPVSVAAGSNLVINVAVIDTGFSTNDTVMFSAYPVGSWPAGATISAQGVTNAIFQWTPTTNQIGATNLQILASEFLVPSNFALTNLQITVTNPVVKDLSPVLGPIADQTIDAGTNFSMYVYATNANNTTNLITFYLQSDTTATLVTNGTLLGVVTNSAGTNGVYRSTFSWEPIGTDAGDNPMSITAIEPASGLSSVPLQFNVMVNLAANCPQYAEVLAALSSNDPTNLVLDNCNVLVVTNTLVVTCPDVTLTAGLTNIVITANNLTRLFTVMPGAKLTLEGITLTTGRSTAGGAIYVNEGGVATLNGCLVQNNSAWGVDGMSGKSGGNDPNYGESGGPALQGWPALGGAICNRGYLAVVDTRFLTNRAAGGYGGNGGNGGDGSYQGGNGGDGGNGALGYGGAIYNYGQLFASNCTFIGNGVFAGNGGNGGTNGAGVFSGRMGMGGSGSIAAGGAICSGPNATIVNALFAWNYAVGGSSAAGGTSASGYGLDGPPGGSGFGGAICMIGGATAMLVSSTFTTNTSVGGNGGDGGDGFYGGGNGGDGGSGVGGCLYNIGHVTLSNCAFQACATIGGTNGLAGSGPFSGRDGLLGLALGGALTNGVTNIFGGLSAANPLLMNGGGGSLPLLDPGTSVNPDSSYQVAANSATASPGPNITPEAQAAAAANGAAKSTSPAGTGPAGVITGPAGGPTGGQGAITNSGTPPNAGEVPSREEMMPPGMIDFRNADLPQVLDVYGMLVNRTLLRPASLPAQTVTLKTQGQLTMKEGIQALEGVLALNGITIINVGDKFAKVLAEAQASSGAAPFSTNSAHRLPDLGQYVTEVIQVTNVKPSELVALLQPFSKIPNGILPIDPSGVLVLRDYAENVKRMLELITKIDVAIPSEFDQEVIPIKYAKASEIASALNSLSSGSGGGGGATVGGSSGAGNSRFGSRTGSRVGGYTGTGQPGATPFGAPGAAAPAPGAQAGSSFTQRLQNIINRASSPTGDIQVLGLTKIIADERTNSLLIFASKDDMKKIKDIVSKLDVVLAQVLIESVIIEVNLTDSHDLGFSYLQHPQTIGNWTGVGAVNNKTFQQPSSYVVNGTTNASGGIPGGFSYLMSFGEDLDVAVAAVQGNSRARILQRPRIQTSHNEPASIFVGESRPYPTSSYYGGGAYGGYSSIQQLEIGVSLDVTPLINPDGLVVMDIHQKIDAFEGNVTIDNVGDVPITSEKEAQAKVSVRDHDTIILGGLIETDKNSNKSGVPFLMDLPLFGYLFRSSHRDEKRTELIVLIRPTVLPTPEIAALTATAEKNKMPGVRATERDLRAEEAQRLKKANQEDQRSQPQPLNPP